jgi:hypothetical protein
MLHTLAAELLVKTSSRVAAQDKVAKVLGCEKMVVADVYGAHEDARLVADAKHYGCEVLGVMGCSKLMKDFGPTAVTAALDVGRALMSAHPQADAIVFPFAALASGRSHRNAGEGIRRDGDGCRRKPATRCGS